MSSELIYNQDAIKKIDQAIKYGLTACAMQVQSQSKTIIKEKDIIDSGRLLNSIEYIINKYTATIGTNVEYAPYVEYGTGVYATGEGGSKAKKIPWIYYDEKLKKFIVTSGQKPRAYLRPALDLVEKDLLPIFQEVWNKVIGK